MTKDELPQADHVLQAKVLPQNKPPRGDPHYRTFVNVVANVHSIPDGHPKRLAIEHIESPTSSRKIICFEKERVRKLYERLGVLESFDDAKKAQFFIGPTRYNRYELEGALGLIYTAGRLLGHKHRDTFQSFRVSFQVPAEEERRKEFESMLNALESFGFSPLKPWVDPGTFNQLNGVFLPGAKWDRPMPTFEVTRTELDAISFIVDHFAELRETVRLGPFSMGTITIVRNIVKFAGV